MTTAQPAPSVRTQIDGRQKEFSDLTARDTGTETLVRPEFQDDADINKILGRFGIDPRSMREVTYGTEVDDSIDLQKAFFAIDQAKKIQIPEELRGKYPTWQSVLNAAETGEYQFDLHQLAERKKQAEERETIRTEDKAKAEVISASPKTEP